MCTYDFTATLNKLITLGHTVIFEITAHPGMFFIFFYEKNFPITAFVN